MSEKTHAELIEKMNSGPIPEHRHDREILRLYAYELDAAHRREVDALKRRCAELDAEIAAKDEVIKRLNDALAEEQRHKMATAENSSKVGNIAKMREALVTIQNCDIGKEEDCYTLYRVCDAALAATPRNCDMGTPAEQTARFAEFCKSHRHSDMPKCAGCPLEDIPDGTGCSQAWGQMPYETEATDGK